MSRTSHVTLRIVPASRGLRTVTGLAWAVAIAACSRRQAPAPATVTFNKDVAPIVFANCAPCHRPGEVAPFTLLGYADLVKHADGVAQATRKREMPPWLPERGDFPIVGERRLRDDQIDTIQRWVKGGMVEGNAADLPKPPIVARRLAARTSRFGADGQPPLHAPTRRRGRLSQSRASIRACRPMSSCVRWSSRPTARRSITP